MGTTEGARKLMQKNPNHFKELGSKGGKKGKTGFKKGSDAARQAALKRWGK